MYSTLMIESDIIIGPPTLQEAIKSTQSPSWPFLNIKLKKTQVVKKTTVEVEVSPSIYNWFVKNFGGDDIPCYFIFSPDPIKSWTPDMRMALEIMAEFDFMNKFEIWARVARESISDYMRKKMNFKPRRKDNAIPICEELLQACKLLEPESRYDVLLPIARDAILSKTRDPDTLIYRLAMLVFHYAFIQSPPVKGLEDWESAYLHFTQDKEINKKYPIIQNKLEAITQKNWQVAFKTILSFIIGSYLYYKGVSELAKKD